MPYVLGGGASRTFTWTFTGSVSGPIKIGRAHV
jgi:hypothetical protein